MEYNYNSITVRQDGIDITGGRDDIHHTGDPSVLLLDYLSGPLPKELDLEFMDNSPLVASEIVRRFPKVVICGDGNSARYQEMYNDCPNTTFEFVCWQDWLNVILPENVVFWPCDGFALFPDAQLYGEHTFDRVKTLHIDYDDGQWFPSAFLACNFPSLRELSISEIHYSDLEALIPFKDITKIGKVRGKYARYEMLRVLTLVPEWKLLEEMYGNQEEIDAARNEPPMEKMPPFSFPDIDMDAQREYVTFMRSRHAT